MKVKIYAYDNSVLEAEVPVDTVEQIKSIYVQIVSGDEIVIFTTIDGKQVRFDAVDAISGRRFMCFDDGSYFVNDPDKIKEWVNYKDDDGDNFCISYNRQEKFCK